MNKDLIILGISTIIIGTASFFLYLDFTAKIKSSGLKKIGTITFKKRVAERKYSGQVIWEDLSQKAPLYNFDSIRTAEDSYSIITLQNGTKIKLDENTLILLTVSDKGTSIDLSKGSIATIASGLKKGQKSIQIKTKGTKVEFTKGSINLSRNENSEMLLSVDEGNAKIKTKDGEKNIGADNIVVFSKSGTKIQEKTISLISPGNNSNVMTLKDGMFVSFSWKLKSKVAVNLELAKDKNFKQILQVVKVIGTNKMLFVPIGTIYWRVKEWGNPSNVTTVNKLHVLKDTLATPLFPRNNKTFYFTKILPTVSFNWTKSKYANQYNIVISKTKSFKFSPVLLQSEGTNISISNLKSGTYYWTIRNKYSFMTEALGDPKSIQTFTIKKKKKITRPLLLSPANQMSYSSIHLTQKSIVFNWQENKDYKNYVLFIAKDAKFSKTIATIKRYSNYYSYNKKLNPGLYYWKIQGSFKNKKIDSITRIIRIALPQAIYLTRPFNNSKVVLNKDGALVSFIWKGPTEVKKYKLLVSKDRSFSKLLISKIFTNKAALHLFTKSGSYFWQVQAIGKGNSVLLRSKIYTMYIKEMKQDELVKNNINDNNLMVKKTIDPLVAPIPLMPLKGKTLDMTYKNKLIFNWKRVKGATHYNIKLFQFKNARLIKVLDMNTRGNSYTLHKLKLLDKGKLYWDIQARTYKWGKIIKSSKAVRSHVSLTVKDPTQKPEIITPGVIYVQ